MESPRKPYRHVSYIDPDEAEKDALTFWFQPRGLALQLLVECSAIGLLAYVRTHPTATATAAAVCVVLYMGSWLERRRRIRQVRLAGALHAIAHYMRDACKDLPSALKEAETSGDNGKYSVLWLTFTERIANEIGAYFQQLVNDSTAGCAIRCSFPADDEGDHFVTVARSLSLNQIERERHTRPIPADQGVARVLRDRNNTGVFFVDNIHDMRNYPEVWYATPTDGFGDARRLMVAPINGYFLDGGDGEKAILGLLFVTTTNKPLKVSHSDHLKAFADLLGLVFPVITHDFGRVGVPKS